MSEDLLAKVGAVLGAIPAVRVAYVFGSTLGGARDDSDLDVALSFAPKTDGHTRTHLILEIIDALTAALGPLGERADLVDLDRAAAAVAFKAIQGRCVFSVDDRERRLLEVRIARRYDDEAPTRALYRRAAKLRWGAA